MSKSPTEWRDNIIENYGNISNFDDAFTVGFVREQIAKKRADFKIMLDAEEANPGIICPQDLAKMKEQDAEIADLDKELHEWQAARIEAEA